MKYYACRVGELIENSHFYKTFHIPIVKKEYKDIRWAINEVSISKKTVDSINNEIKNGIEVYVVLFPNKPEDHPYAMCQLNLIKERISKFEETNSQRGWINKTSSGHDDFKYDFLFSKIYILNKKSFREIKLKGQCTFTHLRNGIKNEDLFEQIEKEIEFIKIYVEPIVL